jgi:transcriptional regulator with XRE-family HTH domain
VKSLNRGAHKGFALVVGEVLRRRRHDAGMSQGELAGRVGVTAASICYYESGSRLPSINTLLKLKSALGFTVRDCIKIIEAMGSGEQKNIQKKD